MSNLITIYKESAKNSGWSKPLETINNVYLPNPTLGWHHFIQLHLWPKDFEVVGKRNIDTKKLKKFFHSFVDKQLAKVDFYKKENFYETRENILPASFCIDEKIEKLEFRAEVFDLLNDDQIKWLKDTDQTDFNRRIWVFFFPDEKTARGPYNHIIPKCYLFRGIMPPEIVPSIFDYLKPIIKFWKSWQNKKIC